MKSSKLVLASLGVMLAACDSSTGPTIATLQNDGYTTGALTFAAGLVADEAAAVRLGPLSTGFTIRNVQFLFGGAATVDSVTLVIYNDVGNDIPGTVLYSALYVLTPADAAMQEIDLSGPNITVAANQMIRIALFFENDGVPSVAPDLDGLTTGRNFVYDGSAGWITAATASITGDWIIRAEVRSN